MQNTNSKLNTVLLIVIVILLAIGIYFLATKNSFNDQEKIEVSQSNNTSEVDTDKSNKNQYTFSNTTLTLPQDWNIEEFRSGSGVGSNWSVIFSSKPGSGQIRLQLASAYEAVTCENFGEGHPDLHCYNIPKGGMLFTESTNSEILKVYESLKTQIQ